MCLYDIQFCKFDDIANDLLYFFVSSVPAEVLIPNYWEILETYRLALATTLTRLGSEQIKTVETVEQIDRILKCGKTYAGYYGVLLPSILCHLTGETEETRGTKYRDAMRILRHFEIL